MYAVYIYKILFWCRDHLVLMEKLADLEQQVLREVVAPRDTKECVDPQAIREPREPEDHPDQPALKETKYTHVLRISCILTFVVLFRAHLVTLDYPESAELMEMM